MQAERVQDIASTSRDIIPEAFIRPEQEWPALTTVHGLDPAVQVIDMSEPDEEKVNGLIINASQEWGIFQIINHGIPSEVIMKLQKVSKEFFELPQEEKEVYAEPAGCMEGYGASFQKETEGKKGWVDHLFHKIWPPSINYQFLPQKPPSYRF